MIELNYLDGVSSYLDALTIHLNPSVIEKPVWKTIYVNKGDFFTIQPNDIEALNSIVQSIVKIKNTDRSYYCRNAVHDLVSKINTPDVVYNSPS